MEIIIKKDIREVNDDNNSSGCNNSNNESDVIKDNRNRSYGYDNNDDGDYENCGIDYDNGCEKEG